MGPEFTFPIVLSKLTVDGKCVSSLGSVVLINEQGWVVTAGHIMKALTELQEETKDALAAEAEAARLDADPGLQGKAKRKAIKRALKVPPDSAARHSAIVLGLPAPTRPAEWRILDAADLAIARLEPFDPQWCRQKPIFKDPSKDFLPGTSLCKIGFPFHAITPTWDAANAMFVLPPGALPVPCFPIEGIFTRTVELVGSPTPAYPLRWVETSSPGLKGQSGGPTMDTEGRIWAIQCQTFHYPLGFNPPVPGSRTGEKEHQFLNVGVGVHPETIFGFFKEAGISYEVSSD